MAAIVCEATGRAEGKGGFFRRRKKKPARRESGSGVEKGGGTGQHVKAGSVLSESHVLEPGV